MHVFQVTEADLRSHLIIARCRLLLRAILALDQNLYCVAFVSSQSGVGSCV